MTKIKVTGFSRKDFTTMISLVIAIYGLKISTEARCANCNKRPVDQSGVSAIFCVQCADECAAVWDSDYVYFDEQLDRVDELLQLGGYALDLLEVL
jgi:hypothetical protein